MVRPVSAGVDGSPESHAAAEWAAHEAALRGVPLRLVQAWQWQPHPPATVPLDESQREWSKRLLSETEAEVTGRHPGLEIVSQQVSDRPAHALVVAADESELLVLGSRGLSGFAGFLLGSVAQTTVARAGRPVVLVRAGADAGARVPASDPEGEVVLGIDPGRPCDELVEFAFAAAGRRRAPLRAVHTWDFASTYGYPDGSPDRALAAELQRREERALSGALRPCRDRHPDVEVTEQVVRGRAGQELVRAAGPASLMVIGRRLRRSPIGPHIGPVAHGVVHHATCPVAVVPHS